MLTVRGHMVISKNLKLGGYMKMLEGVKSQKFSKAEIYTLVTLKNRKKYSQKII